MKCHSKRDRGPGHGGQANRKRDKRGRQPCSVRKLRSNRKKSNELKWERERGGPDKRDCLKKKGPHSKSTPRPMPPVTVKEGEKGKETCEEREIDNKEMGTSGVVEGKRSSGVRHEVRQVKRPLRKKPHIFYLRTELCQRTLLSVTRTASGSEVPPSPASPSHSLGANQPGEAYTG